jgi:ABC-type transporter Mla maintaining outer membrane lipid asymmetry ATPase subunit MlaF
MVMLDKGRVLKIADRAWFDGLRKTEGAAVQSLSTDERIIRQFLRGDAEGPITQRRDATNYADDLLGGGPAMSSVPTVQATRRRD